MYKREFDKLITSGQLPKSLMLCGDNDYYIQEAAKSFIKKTVVHDGVLKLYHDEYDFQLAKNHLGQGSLFGDLNLLLIRSDKKIPKKELTHLLELSQKNDNSYFLYLYTGKDFKSMSALFSKKMKAEHVRFFAPTLKEATQTLETLASQMNIDIDRYAIEHLLISLNLNLSLAVKELEKLAILESPIGTKEIDEHLFSLAPMAMDTFLLSLFSKQPLHELFRHLEQLGEDEFMVLRAIEYFTLQLLQFHIYIKQHGSTDSAAILGYRLPRHLEKQRASLAVRIPLPLFSKILDALAKGELAMKLSPGTVEKETLLLATLIKIKSFLG